MKISKIFIFLIFTVVGVCAFKIYQERSIKPHEYYQNNFYYESYEALKTMVDNRKQETYNKIFLVGGGIISALFMGFIYFNSEENKKDPIKILNRLKTNSILSQEEYKSKIFEAKEIEKKNKNRIKIEKEIDVLISELENLKKSGIISNEEFEDKTPAPARILSCGLFENQSFLYPASARILSCGLFKPEFLIPQTF